VVIITLANICVLMKQRDTENNHADPDTPPKIDRRDWPKTIEAIEEYLRQFRGTNGIPLSYVVRKNIKPAPSADDPLANYDTLDEEMIARAPILTNNAAGVVAVLEREGPFVDSFITDKGTAWDKLHVLFQDHESWTYMKAFRRARNGRLGFLSVHNHYLGPNNVDHMATQAESKLQNPRIGTLRSMSRYTRNNILSYTAWRNTATRVLMSAPRLGISMKVSRLQG
jgi:hypothetical protein